MNNQNILIWFRNDLRSRDSEILYQAAQVAQQTGANIFPIYCFDPRHFCISPFGFTKTGAFRAKFLIESVANLRDSLRSLNCDLIIRIGKPEDFLPEFIRQWGISAIYYHEEITTEEKNVETNLCSAIKLQKIDINCFWGSTLLHPDDLPFTIANLPELFTHFRRQVEIDFKVQKVFPTPDFLPPLPVNLDIGEIPNLATFGLTESITCDRAVLQFRGGETESLKRLDHYFWQSDRLQVYKQTRNGMLYTDDSSKFSPWLALGCISPRYIYAQVKQYERDRLANDSTYWLIFELLWRDYPAIDKTHNLRIAVALKYSGIAEIQGFVLPTYRIAVISDREFFGQHALGTPNYVRKRRRATSKQVDLNQLSPGDYVVHKNHGVGQFVKLEKLTVNKETREYLVLKYADGLLRVVVDQMSILSRYRGMHEAKPELHKMTGKAWTNTTAKAKKAIKKIAFDLLELYAKRSQRLGYSFPPDNPWQQELEDSFPYQATPDQLKATQDVKQDMESARPMDRLVCGDVGFGKTEVAIRTIFKAVTSGKQSALLVPTTILAQQHYHSLQERYAAYPVNIALLNRFKSTSEKKEIIRKLKTGELDIVVGTHQLLAKDVEFKDLGLLVIDEEQRFGVAQKEKIKTMKTEVDVLTLSATPIPRTLYMAMSGVREMSLITTPPPSSITHLSRYNSELVRAAIRQELDRGGQIFYVVSRIDDIEEVSARVHEMLPSIRMAIAHGQMPESELESTMLSFSSGESDMMICTTIIESGLDIPRVNTIIIEDAQRFGLAQLYQLRGRVGRAGIQAHAWLFYQEKGELTDVARKRLKAIQEFTHLGSGYQLAMRDMEIRGMGNLLGAEQSGQINTIGFDLYMEMLQESIAEIRGSEIPEVDDTQVDLPITAFIPTEYIPDGDRKLSAYRAISSVTSRRELNQIVEEWNDCYGKVPAPAMQLIKVMELKLLAKRIGFSRIKPEGKQHIVLESKMEEPAWKLLHEHLPSHLRSRFVYSKGDVTVRGLGTLSHDKQLDSLIEWLNTMHQAKTVA